MTVDKQAAGFDRRSFLRVGGVTAGATALQVLAARAAEAAPAETRHRPGANVDYGPIDAVAALNTGDRWLALPAGFEYTILTKTGDLMSDGSPTPRAHDGMGSFARRGGRTRLICNHEVRFGGTPATQGV
jgi:secreted PhoX family phosphatase